MWPSRKRAKVTSTDSPDFYFNDPEVGTCVASSHPKFVELASAEFFYSESDDFSPFGSDDGADALAMLEEWFRSGGRPHGVIRFLRQTIEEWNLKVPQNLESKTEKGMTTWLNKGEMRESFLASECRLRVAVAFGELKICGRIDTPILNEAKAGIRWWMFLNERAAARHPEWQYADLEAERVSAMRAALERYEEPMRSNKNFERTAKGDRS